VHRLFLAFAAYAALGVLAYTTLSDPRIRLMTLAMLGVFALKTWLRRRDVMDRDERETRPE
jgi:hypothetical protein